MNPSRKEITIGFSVIVSLLVLLSIFLGPVTDFQPVWVIARCLHLLFWISVAAIHIALTICVRRDAGHREHLLLDIPVWVWTLITLLGGVLGVAVYWLANCCRLIQEQTIPAGTTSDEKGGDQQKSG